MSKGTTRAENELRRLLVGPTPEDRPEGMGMVRFVVRCAGDSSDVLYRAKSVLRVIAEHSLGRWPKDSQWLTLLPAWFLSRCAPERAREDAEKWLAKWQSLPLEEQKLLEEEQAWSLADWLYWLEPNKRHWYWWDAKAPTASIVVVAVVAYDWPFPWGDLKWLFRAAGASEMKAEE
jgi:hypothetical protein